LPEQQRNPGELVKFLEEEKLTGLMPSETYLKTIEEMIKEEKEEAHIFSWIEVISSFICLLTKYRIMYHRTKDWIHLLQEN
jgi:hypothetical protein